MNSASRNIFVGARIVAARERNSMSAKTLAELLGITQSRLSNWENGTNGVSADYIYLISEKLSVSSDYLLGLSDDLNVEKKPRYKHAAYNINLEGLSDDDLAAINEQIEMRKAIKKMKSINKE